MLFELNKRDFKLVKELYKEDDHNISVIKSILQGNNSGRVFVDDLKNPQSALVYPSGGFYYISNYSENVEFLRDLNKLFFEEWKVEIVELFLFPDNLRQYLEIILGVRPYKLFKRKDYLLNQRKYQQISEKVLHRSLGGLSLSVIDQKFLEKYQVKLETWESQKAFLANGYGYCLMDSDTIVSKCLVAHKGGILSEMEVHTEEDYRQCGFATFVCAILIDTLLDNNLLPTWSCWEFNQPSWKLAEKLGFELKDEKEVVLWDTFIK